MPKSTVIDLGMPAFRPAGWYSLFLHGINTPLETERLLLTCPLP